MLSRRDRDIAEAYTKTPAMTEPKVANLLNVSRHEVRGALRRCRLAGLDVAKPEKKKPPIRPERTDTVTKIITNLSNSSVDEKIARRPVTLPKLAFIQGEVAADPPRPRIKAQPSEAKAPLLTEREIFLLKRLALLKQVHQDGLRRGLFRIHSR